MRGQILDYSIQTNTGTISGADGNRYTFSGAEWKGPGSPTRAMTVDFEADGIQARGVYRALGGGGAAGSKNKVVAGVLAILLGWWGVHKFYLGYTGPGLVYLLVNTVGFAITWLLLFIPNIVLGVMALVEGIIYLTKSDEEFEQQYVVDKRPWF
jgi:TM2 domain-containing membrane protein YozV